jgi:hypothetical protein
LKGWIFVKIAKIRLTDGAVKLAELHWYEGHGKVRKETFTGKRI